MGRIITFLTLLFFCSAAYADTGTSRVKITDGTRLASVKETGSADYLGVAIVDASGTQITSFGGGTEYTQGDTDASITGSAFLMEVAADTLQPIQGTVADGLLVNLGANNDVVVTGTVDLGATDNAVLDAIAASVAAIDTDTTTIIGHVDGIEGILTTIDTDTGNMDTSLNNIETAIQIMDDWDNTASDGASVSGDVAHDGIDAGEPVKIGGKALDVGSIPAAVAANDRVNAAFLRNGVQLHLGGSVDIKTQNIQITDADGAQTDLSLVGTIAAGTVVIVTKASVMADGDNTDFTMVRIGFGTANTPAADAAQIVLFHPDIAAGSGDSEGSGAGIIGIGATGDELRMTCDDPVGGSISVIITYFTLAIG